MAGSLYCILPSYLGADKKVHLAIAPITSGIKNPNWLIYFMTDLLLAYLQVNQFDYLLCNTSVQYTSGSCTSTTDLYWYNLLVYGKVYNYRETENT
jgi:hypothetical protein